MRQCTRVCLYEEKSIRKGRTDKADAICPHPIENGGDIDIYRMICSISWLKCIWSLSHVPVRI